MAAYINRFAWFVALAAIVLLAYAVPYLFLSSVERLAGAFLFWTLFGGCAVALIIYATTRWRV
ncbi:hypothetical protein [Fodinicurvata sp. EGI_FJ10296]|uniref:hypothetical protein n=1 Tax=Fodinicurvata sp. EGI_FJ10296 TaxID=3231908 RepID=UPI0034559688